MEAPTDSKAPPAIWHHVLRVYDAMAEQAKEVAIEDDGQSTYFESPATMYEGFTSHLFQELGIAVPNYGPVLDLLREMGCITQERRGGGPSPSVWRLWKRPTLEDFERAHVTVPRVEAKVRKQQHEEQRITDIQKQLGGIDIPRAIADLQNQINVIRADMQTHERNLHGHTEPFLARDDPETS